MDFYSLLTEGDEGAAKAKAQMISALLSREEAQGQLMQMHPLLKQMGQGVAQSAGQQRTQLADVGQMRTGNVLRERLAKQQTEAQAARDAAELASREREGARNRSLQREIEGGRVLREEAKTKRAEDKATRDAATDLRKEFNGRPEVKEFRGIETSYRALKDSVKDPTGAGGIATIFNFMKMLDPGVAVMEGDVALIRSAGGPAAAFAGLYERALTGNPLPGKVMKEIEARADKLYGLRKSSYDDLSTEFRGLADRRGAPADDVVASGAPPSGGGYTIDLEEPDLSGLSPAEQKRFRELMKMQAEGGAK